MNNQVSLKWALPYAIVGFARDAIYMFVLSFYYLYLTTVLDLSSIYIIPIFLIIKLVDVIKEPFIGMLIDLCADVFKYNKFRMTVLAGGILNSAVLLQMFDIPYMHQSVQVIYAIFMYLMWALTFSLIDIPSWSITSIFGSDHKTREIICAIVRASAVVGFVLVMLLAYFIIYQDQGVPDHIYSPLNENLFRSVSWYVAGITFISAILFYVFFDMEEPKRKVVRAKEAASTFFGNDQLMIIFFLTLLQQTCLCVFVGYQNFFAITIHHVPSDDEIFFYIQVPWLVVSLLTYCSFHHLVKYTSRRQIFIFSTLLILLSFLTLYAIHTTARLTMGSLSFLICLLALGFCLSQASTTVMTADCIDYGEFKFGCRSECMNFSVQIVSAKFGSLAAMIFATQGSAYASLFTSTGLDENLLFNSVNIFMVVVCVCTIGMMVIYTHYYKLHGSFFEKILNAITHFGANRNSAKSNLNSVRYALDENSVIYNLKAQSLDEIIHVLTDRLSMVRAINSKHDFLKAIKEKMEQNPAGIAHGIAIPHARGSFVNRSAVAVASLSRPINCGALDNKPCDLFFLIAVPDDGKSHISILANLSLILSEPGFADKLRRAGSSEEITKRLILCEKKLFK